MRMKEAEEAHYEVTEVPFGRVYSWRPASIKIECDCGGSCVLTAAKTHCCCGADYSAWVRREIKIWRSKGQCSHPWAHWVPLEEGLPF